MRKDQSGMTLLETAIGSMISVLLILSVSSVTQQNQKRFDAETSRIEMQQKGRAIVTLLSHYLRSAGANRAGAFSSPPYTTSSSLPIPRANATLIRIRSDYNDDGAVSGAPPEDVTVSWNSVDRTLQVGSMAFDQVRTFVIHFYDGNGTELAPPPGGWDVSANASHGAILSSLERVRLEIGLEARQRDLDTKQVQQMTLMSEAAISNQLVQ